MAASKAKGATKKRPGSSTTGGSTKRATAKTTRAAGAIPNPVRDKWMARGWVPPPSLASPAIVEKLRTLCTSFPEATERLSHGATCFFVGSKAFAKISDNHHSDGRFAVIVAAPPGAQTMLVDSEPDHYYEPPYVRHLGWIGVRLDRDVPWTAVEALVEGAYLEVAPPKLASVHRGHRGGQNTID